MSILILHFIGNHVCFQHRIIVEGTDTATININHGHFIKLRFGIALKHIFRIADKRNQSHVVELRITESQNKTFFHRIKRHALNIDFFKRNFCLGSLANQIMQLVIGFQNLRQIVVAGQPQHVAVLDFKAHQVFAVRRTVAFTGARV